LVDFNEKFGFFILRVLVVLLLVVSPDLKYSS
jgi:hypothetical protein